MRIAATHYEPPSAEPRHWIKCFLKMEALSAEEVSGGVVHGLPADLRKALTSDAKALETWEDITPLARNEWICWIKSAKKAETRDSPGRMGLFQSQRRKAQTLLLAWLSASLRNYRDRLDQSGVA